MNRRSMTPVIMSFLLCLGLWGPAVKAASAADVGRDAPTVDRAIERLREDPALRGVPERELREAAKEAAHEVAEHPERPVIEIEHGAVRSEATPIEHEIQPKEYGAAEHTTVKQPEMVVERETVTVNEIKQDAQTTTAQPDPCTTDPGNYHHDPDTNACVPN